MLQRFHTPKRHYYNRLPLPEQAIYKRLYLDILRGQNVVEVPTPWYMLLGGKLPSGLAPVDYAFLLADDNPGLFYFDAYNSHYRHWPPVYGGREGKIRVELDNYYTPQEVERVRQLLLTRAGFILDDMPEGVPEVVKLRYLHDYLAKNVSYCHEYETLSGRDRMEVQTVVGALLNRKCVCAGYAKAFKLLCDQIGLDCYILTGKYRGVGHSWNVVRLNGYYYHVDVTGAGQNYLAYGNTDHSFLRSAGYFRRQGYQWPGRWFPATPSDL